MTILRLLLILAVIIGSYCEPVAQTNFSFGLPFLAIQSDPCPRYPEGLCLADSLVGCDNKVALISSMGVCSARTSYRFRYEVPGGAEFEATLLEGAEGCLSMPSVAVVGVDASAVRVIPFKEDQSPLPKDLESKARGLLKHWIMTSTKADEFGDIRQNPLSNSPPTVLKAGELTMLRFELNEGMEGWKKDRGPAVLLLNDQLFRLEGWCTDDHRFFSVNDRSYLAYTLHCCGCGRRILYVYDLSGEAFKKVYENENLSD